MCGPKVRTSLPGLIKRYSGHLILRIKDLIRNYIEAGQTIETSYVLLRIAWGMGIWGISMLYSHILAGLNFRGLEIKLE